MGTNNNMLWQAVVNASSNGVKSRQLVNVEAESFQQARELLLAEYGPESINIGPRLAMTVKDNNNNEQT